MEEVRHAVRNFVARHNAYWLSEKNGFRSWLAARAARLGMHQRRAIWRSRVFREPAPVDALMAALDLLAALYGLPPRRVS